MSDFDIHKTCETYRCIEHLALGNHLLCDSGFRGLRLLVIDDHTNHDKLGNFKGTSNITAFPNRKVPAVGRHAAQNQGEGRQGAHLLSGWKIECSICGRSETFFCSSPCCSTCWRGTWRSEDTSTCGWMVRRRCRWRVVISWKLFDIWNFCAGEGRPNWQVQPGRGDFHFHTFY